MGYGWHLHPRSFIDSSSCFGYIVLYNASSFCVPLALHEEQFDTIATLTTIIIISIIIVLLLLF